MTGTGVEDDSSPCGIVTDREPVVAVLEPREDRLKMGEGRLKMGGVMDDQSVRSMPVVAQGERSLEP